MRLKIYPEITKADVYGWLDEKLVLEDWVVLDKSTEHMSTFLEHYLEPQTPAETWIIFYAVVDWLIDHDGGAWRDTPD